MKPSKSCFGKCRQLLWLAIALYVATFAACETANYVPPVTQITRSNSRTRKRVDLASLDRGRQLFAHRCIECHTLPPIWHYSNDDWPHIVDDMAHRASLKPSEREAVVAYILAVRASER